MRGQTWTILVLLGLVAPIQGQTTLAWKFQEGSSFFLERHYHQKQSIDVKGKNFKQESTNTWLTKIVVKKVTDDQAILEQTIVSVTYKTLGKPAPGADTAAEAQLAEKLKGSSFRATVSRAGRVRKFEGYDDAIQKVAEKQEEREKALRFLIPEAALRDGLAEVLGFLPEKAVQPGDTWQRQATEPIPPFGSFKTEFHYTYQGRVDGHDAITSTVRMKYEPPTRDLTLFRVVKGEVRADEGKGLILFDATTGKLISGQRQILLRGNLTIEAANNQAELAFTSENQLTWRLLTEAPK